MNAKEYNEFILEHEKELCDKYRLKWIESTDDSEQEKELFEIYVYHNSIINELLYKIGKLK